MIGRPNGGPAKLSWQAQQQNTQQRCGAGGCPGHQPGTRQRMALQEAEATAERHANATAESKARQVAKPIYITIHGGADSGRGSRPPDREGVGSGDGE